MADYDRAGSPMDSYVKPEDRMDMRSRSRSPLSRSRSPPPIKREMRGDSRSRSPPPRSSSRRGDEVDRRRRTPSPPRRSRSGDRRRRSISPRRRSRSPRDHHHSRRRSPPPRHRHEGNKEFHGTRDEPEMSNILGVFGLSLRTREIDLEEVFREFGQLEKVTVVYDHRSNRSRGFGFVYFKSQEEATRARDACNGMDIDDRKIRVDYSVTHRPHTPTPGEYMGERRVNTYRDERRPYRDDRRHGGHHNGGGRRGRSRSRSPDRRRRYYRSRSRSWSR